MYEYGSGVSAGSAGAGGGGTANRGGGGGGNGGSGVVVIRYADTFPDLGSISVGLTYTGPVTSGGYKVYQFTAGTGNITV
mgnify:FL=1